MTSKINFKLAIVFTLLGLAMVGCTQDSVFSNTQSESSTFSVTYIVQGRSYYENPITDEEWSSFLDRMLALAEEGYTVQFWGAGTPTYPSKEKITHTTTSQDEAKEWCRTKEEEGYRVTLTYNQATGVYTCIAVK